MRKAVKKVFLTYARADEGAARELSASLQAAGFNVWDPEREILPGDEWTSSLKRALDTSDAMVVLLSPDAFQSRSVRQEVEYALVDERFSGRLIPVLVRETKDYPWILKSLNVIRYQNPQEAGRAVVNLLNQPADAPQKSRAR